MNFIKQELSDYCAKYSSSENEILNAISRKTWLTQINPRMLSGHLEGTLLHIITQLINPKSVLEIGTFTGYSAISIALALGENSHLHTIEIEEELKDDILTNFQNAGVQNKVTLHLGNAMDIIPALIKETSFDMVFIDADKEHYPDYFLLMKDHLKSGGVLLADNVLWSGKVLDTEALTKDSDTRAIHAFNELLASEPSFIKVVLPIRDGITIARKV